MQSREIRKKFLDFFAKRGHKIIPSSSLIPDDPSVLLTTAGMQQFKKYYTGEADPMKDFGSKNTASIQKSFRTSDIEEVGDDSHLTFFEMLGNFSFGGYFKKEAITYAFEFITKEIGLPVSFVTVFEGSQGIAKDEESGAIWKSLGVEDVREQGLEDVFWGPTGNSGPCGPTTEIYCKNSAGGKAEVWNIVFNEFFFAGSRAELLSGNSPKKLERLETPGVDTGMGLERLAMIVQGKKNIFETDLFSFGFLLKNDNEDITRHARIVADHLRGAVFLLADGVRPSNKEAGYILRRLLRRLLIRAKKISIPQNRLEEGLQKIIEQYGGFYNELKKEEEKILNEFRIEAKKFNNTLEKGLREFDRRYPDLRARDGASRQAYEPFMVKQRVGQDAFDLYQTYGFPVEDIKELLEERFYKFDEEEFNKKLAEEFKKHQEVSRAGREKKFGGHGLILDTGELKAGDPEELKKVTRLHTATHLLNVALRKVLGPDIQQQGSDINAERTRFDFTFPRKLTAEEIKKIEDWVNEAIARKLDVRHEEMPYEKAIIFGALRFWREKYPAMVKVYTIYDSATGEVLSKELCGGPHVKNTSEIGGFKIIKEESSSAGIRRVRAVVSGQIVA